MDSVEDTEGTGNVSIQHQSTNTAPFATVQETGPAAQEHVAVAHEQVATSHAEAMSVPPGEAPLSPQVDQLPMMDQGSRVEEWLGASARSAPQSNRASQAEESVPAAIGSAHAWSRLSTHQTSGSPLIPPDSPGRSSTEQPSAPEDATAAVTLRTVEPVAAEDASSAGPPENAVVPGQSGAVNVPIGTGASALVALDLARQRRSVSMVERTSQDLDDGAAGSNKGFANVLSLLKQQRSASMPNSGTQRTRVLTQANAAVASVRPSVDAAEVRPSQQGSSAADSYHRNVSNVSTSSTAASISQAPSTALFSPPPFFAPEMKQQVKRIFFGEDNLAHPQPSPGAQQSGAEHPSSEVTSAVPTLAAQEHDATSTSSSQSLATPLRIHLEGAPRPYTGAPKPGTEEDRAQHLCSLEVLGTTPEKRYDRLTRLAATVFSVPIVLVSLVDHERQWFKSVVGLPGVTETDRRSSFCAWTLLPQCPECLVVMDAPNDARFRNNSLVSGPPFIQFYAGCPLISSNGSRLGSLCIIDTRTRYFTTEDCNLLCNFAEVAVRELEAGRAMSRLAHLAMPDEDLRPSSAWDVGILVVQIVNESWVLRSLNDRAGQVLDIADVDHLVGTDFWKLFTARASAAAAPAERFRLHLLEGLDFSLDASCFTDSGRKIWVTLNFRSGTQSHVDDDCPVVTIPMDLASEPGTKASYWFVVVQPMPAERPRGPMSGLSTLARLSPALVGSPDGCNNAAASTEGNEGAALVSSSEVAAHFTPETLQGMVLSGNVSQTPEVELVHALHTAPGAASPESVLAQVFPTDSPAEAAEIVASKEQQWRDLGMAEHALLDTVRTEFGRDVLLLLQRLPMPICTSMRTAIHEGVFKQVPNSDELYNGIVSVDTALVLECLLHVARGIAALHKAGHVHGDLSDATVTVTTRGPKATAGAMWRHGRDLTVRLATLGSNGADLTLEDLAGVRADLQLFYAPERFSESGAIAAQPDMPGDVWALGMLLIYCMRLSLPLVPSGPLTLLDKAAKGTLLNDVLQLNEQPMPAELSMLITLCLSPQPEGRPTAARLVAGLQHILSACTESRP